MLSRPQSPSSAMPMGIIASRMTISGTFASSVARHGETSCALESGRRLSDFLDDILSQKPGWFNQKNRDEDKERHPIFVLAAARQVADDHDFDQPKHERAQDSAGDVPNP